MSTYKILIKKHVEHSGVSYSPWFERTRKRLWWTECDQYAIVRHENGNFYDRDTVNLFGLVQRFKTEEEAIAQADEWLKYHTRLIQESVFKPTCGISQSWNIHFADDGTMTRERNESNPA